MLYLYLAREAGKRNESDKVIYYTDKVTPEKVSGLLLNALILDQVFRLVGESVTNLTLIYENKRAYRIIKMFDNPANRSMLYAYAASSAMRRGMLASDAIGLIDSAHMELKRIENRDAFQGSRFLIAFALTLENDNKIEEAYSIIKNMDAKWIGINRMCQALSYQGQLFEAVNNIPDNISDADYTLFLRFIINGYTQRSTTKVSSDWNDYDANMELILNYYINYQNDKN